jgi:hypothetical protein
MLKLSVSLVHHVVESLVLLEQIISFLVRTSLEVLHHSVVLHQQVRVQHLPVASLTLQYSKVVLQSCHFR